MKCIRDPLWCHGANAPGPRPRTAARQGRTQPSAIELVKDGSAKELDRESQKYCQIKAESCGQEGTAICQKEGYARAYTAPAPFT